MRPIDGDVLVDYLAGELIRKCSTEELSAEDAVIEALWKVYKTPSLVIPGVVHAHWICISPELKLGIYTCSYCGQFYMTNNASYCPGCGAKMDEEAEHGKADSV